MKNERTPISVIVGIVIIAILASIGHFLMCLSEREDDDFIGYV